MGANDTQQFYEALNEDLSQFYEESLAPVELLASERYSDHRFIAEGSIKEVFKVYDAFCNRYVAMAMIRKEIFDRGTALDFVREVQLTASLEHPSIARIYDVGIHEGNPYFTMELAEGEPLDVWLRNNPGVSEFRKLEIFRELCNAVEYAHERDILHLDIKPANVLVSDFGRVTLMDWGISYYTSQDSKGMNADLLNAHTLHGYIKGTPGFMAPEQAETNYQKSASADVFGLAATLYFMLSGKPPFEGDHINAVISNSRWGKLREDEAIPRPLFAVLKKALTSLPGHRYSCVKDLKQEVVNYLTGFATSAERSSFFTQCRLFLHRHKAVCLSSAILVLSLVGLNVYYISSLQKREEEAQLAKQLLQDENAKLLEARDRIEMQRVTNIELNESLASYLGDEISVLLDFGKFDQALKAANDRFQAAPSNVNATLDLGLVHFVRQEFSQAHHYLQNVKKPGIGSLLKIAKQHKDNNKLTASETIKIYSALGRGHRKFQFSFLRYNGRIKPPAEHALLVKHVLRSMNRLPKMNFKYDPAKGVLDISDNPRLKKFEVKVPRARNLFPLNSLRLTQINISKTGINKGELQNSFGQRYIKIVGK